jgi:hypothetical protein
MTKKTKKSTADEIEAAEHIEEIASILAEEPSEPAVVIPPMGGVPDELIFRFEVGPAILAQLLAKLKKLPAVSLDEGIDALYAGFYQLFHKNTAVYIGKSSRPIGERLAEHKKKISGRVGLSMGDMTCRYVYVVDPSLVDVAEKALISFFRVRGMADWNSSGFGSKVTGYGRGKQKASKWTSSFPFDLQRVVTAGYPNPITLPAFVEQLRLVSPPPFSIPDAFYKDFIAEHQEISVSIAEESKAFADWVLSLEALLATNWRVERLPEGWYITKKDK